MFFRNYTFRKQDSNDCIPGIYTVWFCIQRELKQKQRAEAGGDQSPLNCVSLHSPHESQKGQRSLASMPQETLFSIFKKEMGEEILLA